MGEHGSCLVPLLDLRAEYEPLRERVLRVVDGVLSSGRLYLGPQTEALEAEFAGYCGASYGVACSSGTDALILALQALGIGPGDQVITVSHTFIATVASIALLGARPIFADIESNTYTMDVSQVGPAITPRTRAILPVHLYGHPADMEALLPVARRNGLAVIEDAAQAHGAEYSGRRVGGLGDIGCFSFVFTKSLRAYGDAGMLVTNDRSIADRARSLRDHGRSARYSHEAFGWNARIDEVQAAILRLKLPLLDGWNERRRTHAQAYNEAFSGVDVKTPAEGSKARHVYHQYVIEAGARDRVQRDLARRRIETGVHYPIPCHLQEACRDLGYGPGDLPVTERCTGRILSLPVYPELTDDQRTYVANSLIESVSNKAMEEQAA